jgi:hypothetical protein
MRAACCQAARGGPSTDAQIADEQIAVVSRLLAQGQVADADTVAAAAAQACHRSAVEEAPAAARHVRSS